MKAKSRIIIIIFTALMILNFALVGCGESSKADPLPPISTGTGPTGTGTYTYTGTSTFTNTGTVTYTNTSSNPGSMFSGKTVPGNASLGLATSPEAMGIAGGTTLEKQILSEVNNLRAQYSLPPLTWDNDLADMGRSHAEDCSQKTYQGHGSFANQAEYLGHARADFLGISPYFDSVPGYGRILENCFHWPGRTGVSAVEVVFGDEFDGWQDSTGHLNAIICGYTNRAGVGVSTANGDFTACLEMGKRK